MFVMCLFILANLWLYMSIFAALMLFASSVVLADFSNAQGKCLAKGNLKAYNDRVHWSLFMQAHLGYAVHYWSS